MKSEIIFRKDQLYYCFSDSEVEYNGLWRETRFHSYAPDSGAL